MLYIMYLIHYIYNTIYNVHNTLYIQYYIYNTIYNVSNYLVVNLLQIQSSFKYLQIIK